VILVITCSSDVYNILVLFVLYLGTVWCTILFIGFIACSSHHCLDVSLFKKTQDYEEKTLSSSKWEARQMFLDHIDPIYFLPLVTLMHAFPKLNTYLPLGMEIVSR
jgi:hypothetical protein